MASEITNFKCPSCTAALRYSADTGKLECDYCGSSFTVKEIEALYGDVVEEAVQAAENAAKPSEEDQAYQAACAQWGEDGANLKVYNCPSCGAQLFCEETTAATSCPYCGNNTILPGQVSGMLKPDYIIPFKVNKDQAVDALRRYYKGKRLLPKAFAQENHIEEIKGIYVPFWLYDVDANADLSFHATRVHTSIRGDEQITVTEHYNVRRSGTVSFEKIPADASSKMPDAHMDAIEPYDYSELMPFSTAYLPGFLADKYDQSEEECRDRAGERAVNSAVNAMEQDVSGYSTCTVSSTRTNLHPRRSSYALFPVWLLATRWKGKGYLFAMNGQTGKLIGDLPVSMGRYWAWFAGIALPLMGIIAAFLYMGGML